MRKTVRGASINLTHPRSVGTQHWSNAWLTGSGKAGPVDPVRTRRRQNHVRQEGSSGAERLSLGAKTCGNFAILTAIRRASSFRQIDNLKLEGVEDFF